MTKTILLSFFMAFSTSLISSGDPAVKLATVNVEKSTVKWIGKKITGKHEGTINIKEGSLEFDEKGNLTGGSLEIDMTSIQCTDLSGGKAESLVGHLGSDDFFGIDKFPTSSITITNVVKNSEGTYTVTGDATIKGLTHPVSFDTKVLNNSAIATISIDRTLYGIQYGSGSFFENLGDKAINDKFTLEVELSF